MRRGGLFVLIGEKLVLKHEILSMIKQVSGEGSQVFMGLEASVGLRIEQERKKSASRDRSGSNQNCKCNKEYKASRVSLGNFYILAKIE